MYTVFNLKPILIEKAFVISPEGLKLFLSLIDWYKLVFFFFLHLHCFFWLFTPENLIITTFIPNC